MVMALKATPRVILKGIRDVSRSKRPIEVTNLPQHLPLFFLLTEKSDVIQIVGGNAARQIYGDKTFDANSDFYNHQTKGAEITMGNANQIMVYPIKLPNAKASSIRLSAELIPATVNNKVVTRVIYHADAIDASSDEDFGNGQINVAYRKGSATSKVTKEKLGELVDEAGVAYYTDSIKLPIIDLVCESTGSYGNQFGITLDGPTQRDANPTDNVLADTLKNFIYRMTLVKKSTATANPSFIYNNHSDIYSDFVLQSGVVNTYTNKDISFPDVITSYYQETEDKDKPDSYGPFPKVALYQEHIEVLAEFLAKDYAVTGIADNGSQKVFTVPGIYGPKDDVSEDVYRINILTGVDWEGKKYETADFTSARKFGGVRLGSDSVIYGQGGNDGFPMLLGAVDKLKLLQIYDETVRQICDNFTDVNPFYDSARYPFSNVWDTGFSLDTKMALMKPTGQHKRIWATVGTHAVADYKDPATKQHFYYKNALTGAEEVAVGMRLKAAAMLIPESDEFGTPTVRIAICSRSGVMVDGSYRGRLPLTIELINKVSKYMGSGDGNWDIEYAFDQWPNNTVELMKDINVTYQSPNVYNKSWDAGIMWVQNIDMHTTFFPAFRTVYPDDTSILVSYINMIGCCYLERVCENVWRRLVGNGLLTSDQFIEHSNRLITEEVAGKFHGRFRIVPNTYFTDTDSFMWNTEIDFYGNNMKSVGKFIINSRSMADYLPSQAT